MEDNYIIAPVVHEDGVDKVYEPIVKITDTLPIGTEVDYDGENIPSGWEEIGDTVQATIGTTNPNNDRVWFKQGKNLCNNETLNLAINYQTNKIIGDGSSKTVYAYVPTNTNITISKTSVTNRFRVGLLNSIPAINDDVNVVFRDDDSSTLSTTINTSTYTIVAIQYTNSNQTTNIQVEIGDTATTYETYIVPSIIIDKREIYNKDNVDIEDLTSQVEMQTDFTLYSGNVYRIGKVVYVKLAIQGDITTSDKAVLKLPIKPKDNINSGCFLSSSLWASTHVGYMFVSNTNGIVSVKGSSTFSVVKYDFSYIID